MLKRSLTVLFVVLFVSATANAQVNMIPSLGFDQGNFYRCSVMGCSASALSSFLFGPAGFAVGCTATLISCAGNSIRTLPNYPRIAEFKKESKICLDFPILQQLNNFGL